MPILQNAKKALRVSKRKRKVNTKIRSQMKNMMRAFRESPSEDLLAQAFSAIDRAAKKNVIHKNKASRLKSQLSQLLAEK